MTKNLKISLVLIAVVATVVAALLAANRTPESSADVSESAATSRRSSRRRTSGPVLPMARAANAGRVGQHDLEIVWRARGAQLVAVPECG
ncbi:hypothetical protein [Streptomyces viridosporus]|uniref:hypothetical protein n=1 Tax=Streptomyces viridosporus TaxID=67581 RepID=UPI0036FB6E30